MLDDIVGMIIREVKPALAALGLMNKVNGVASIPFGSTHYNIWREHLLEDVGGTSQKVKKWAVVLAVQFNAMMSKPAIQINLNMKQQLHVHCI